STLLAHPLLGTSQRLGGKPAEPHAAELSVLDDARPPEDGEVLGDGWERDGEGGRDLRYGGLAACQPCDDRSPGRVGEGSDHGVQFQGDILNHSVKYCPPGGPGASPPPGYGVMCSVSTTSPSGDVL